MQTTWGTNVDANLAVGQTNLAAATSNYWQITGVQLEVGSVATPFEFEDIGTTLAKCLRYFWRHTSRTNDAAVGSGVIFDATYCLATLVFPVPSRTTSPTVTASAATALEAVVGGAVLQSSAIGFAEATNYSAQMGFTISGGTAGQGAFVRFDGANSYIQMSDEL